MTTVQMVARQVPYWTTVYRRTWRGGIVSSIVQPLLYVVAMGLLLGQYVGGGERLGGAASYLVFIAPGLAATQSMMIAFGEAAWPVMGMLTWDKVYTAMAASPGLTASVGDSAHAASSGSATARRRRKRLIRRSPSGSARCGAAGRRGTPGW